MNPKLKAALVHTSLFVTTFITTTLAGAEWVHGKSILAPGYTLNDFMSGLSYSIPFLLILTVHEFGHYFTAVYNKVKTSLPYYIPLPPLPLMLGTLGAIIRIRSRIHSTQQNFDIGIAGPLAGFVVAFALLYYGFSTLPPPEYIYQFHPEYEQYGLNYADHVYSPEHLAGAGVIDIVIGKSLLFYFFEKFVADPTRIPNSHELIHYPLLFAGFLSLVFTSLNLLPIGQLDGGHVLYGLVGFKRHRVIASTIFCLFLFYSALGALVPGEELDIFGVKLWHSVSILAMIGFLYLCLGGLRLDWKNTLMLAVIIFSTQYFIVMAFPGLKGYSGWLLFAFILGRFVSVPHPPTEIEEPLGFGRKLLGWLALVIFIICLTPDPLQLSAP
jgi:membrane-associated protease RseP (regulator of RpoE activity)